MFKLSSTHIEMCLATLQRCLYSETFDGSPVIMSNTSLTSDENLIIFVTCPQEK